MSDRHIVYISVGSNMGDRLQNCRQGITALNRSGESRIIAQSRIYMTEPVDYEDQDWFINMVVKLETANDPFELLDIINRVQRAAGRKRDVIRYGPRVLDLDIIFFGNLVLDSDRLVVPHPRMHQRRFVLQPICDIDPTMVHPVLKKDMQSLLDGLAKDEQKVIEFK
ncbi:MAG: 2-amino-4-hydroxy-6-hydroxymethyldihydropteridine diphosphokinase [Desulfobacterales bacterium]|jgi:2-amino-4-hydroxy-6-hydroxymethyldihydropteridine diphosphokinase